MANGIKIRDDGKKRWIYSDIRKEPKQETQRESQASGKTGLNKKTPEQLAAEKRAETLKLQGIGEPVVKGQNETTSQALERSGSKTARTFAMANPNKDIEVGLTFTSYSSQPAPQPKQSNYPQSLKVNQPTKRPALNTYQLNTGAINEYFSQLSDQERQKREVAAINAYKDYTYRIESSINRRNEFFSSDGFKRIETTATDTNKFLRNAFKYTPIGYVADKTGISPKGGLLDKTGVEIGKTSYGLGIGLGGALPTIGENIAASIDAATIGKYTGDKPITYYLNANEQVVINNPNPKNKVGNFYGQGLVDVEKTSFNFLPFGTPIDEKGLTTLAFIGFGAGQLTVNPQFQTSVPLKFVKNDIQIANNIPILKNIPAKNQLLLGNEKVNLFTGIKGVNALKPPVVFKNSKQNVFFESGQFSKNRILVQTSSEKPLFGGKSNNIYVSPLRQGLQGYLNLKNSNARPTITILDVAKSDVLFSKNNLLEANIKQGTPLNKLYTLEAQNTQGKTINIDVITTLKKNNNLPPSLVIEKIKQPLDIVGANSLNKKSFTTFGVDIGSRSLPIFSFGEGKFFLGTPKGVGIAPSTLAKSTPFPATSLGGAAFRKIIDFTPAEQARINTGLKIGTIVQSEKGLPVKSFELNMEGLRNPAQATRVTQEFINQQRGVIFGSLTTKQLPKVYQNIKIGDVDVIFPQRTATQLEPAFKDFASKLRGAGEDVRVSESNSRVIEFSKTGKKFLEGKAKDEPIVEVNGVYEDVPLGVGGIKFPDLKKGQIKKTVPFGDVRAITIGEQATRKLAGTLITSPGKTPGETTSFSSPGLLGRQGNPRGLKDTAGFIQTSKGIAEIKINKLNPIENLKGEKVKSLTDDFVKTYSPEQQADIINKVQDITGTRLQFGDLQINKGSTANTKTTFGSAKSTYNYPSTTSTQVIPLSPASPSIVSSSSPVVSIFKPSTSSFRSTYSPSPYSFKSPNKSSSGYNKSPSPSIVSSPSPVVSIFSPSPSNFKSTFSPSPSTFKSGFSPGPSKYKSPFGSSININTKITQESYYRKPPVPSNKNDFGSGFDVEVRRRGKFQRVNQEQLGLSKALKLGAGVVSGTAAASFRVLPRSGSAGSLDTGTALGNLGSRFRLSKKDNNVFVQKSQFRISSFGEKREITLKGINTPKKKKGKGRGKGLFDL